MSEGSSHFYGLKEAILGVPD